MVLTFLHICGTIAAMIKPKEGCPVAKWRVEYRVGSASLEHNTVVANEVTWDSDFVQFIGTQKMPEQIVFVIDKRAVLKVERQADD